MIQNIVFAFLLVATAVGHIGSYCLRTPKDWRAKGLLGVGLVSAACMAILFFLNRYQMGQFVGLMFGIAHGGDL
jgi:hypothetical protein